MQVFVTIYVSLIVAGRRTIEQVPANIREDVNADLTALGYEQ
ncbi:CD1375 family protein [Paenibacillus sp. JJ-223]|nr:CD1375 family protein [Paenibacillus sp. JJ-223]